MGLLLHIYRKPYLIRVLYLPKNQIYTFTRVKTRSCEKLQLKMKFSVTFITLVTKKSSTMIQFYVT